jgi:hypothetical protein
MMDFPSREEMRARGKRALERARRDCAILRDDRISYRLCGGATGHAWVRGWSEALPAFIETRSGQLVHPINIYRRNGWTISFDDPEPVRPVIVSESDLKRVKGSMGAALAEQAKRLHWEGYGLIEIIELNGHHAMIEAWLPEDA